MSLEDTSTFLLVVSTGSFTAAAERLSLPVSSVSRRVARLEARLGLSLLQRSTRSLHLTAAGEVYASEMRDLLQRMDDLENRVTGLTGAPSGRLRVTVPSGFSEDTGDLLARFLREYPAIRLQLLEEDRLVDLIGEGVDVAFRGSLTHDPGVVAIPLLETHFGLFASPRFSRPALRTLADLAGIDCILYSSAEEEVWTLSRHGVEESITVTGRFASRNLRAVRNATVQGLGVSLMPEVACQAEIAAGLIEPVLPDYQGALAPGWLLYPQSRFTLPALQAFIAFMRRQDWPSVIQSGGLNSVHRCRV